MLEYSQDLKKKIKIVDSLSYDICVYSLLTVCVS